MKDTNYIDENGGRTPVSLMSTKDLRDCLYGGFKVCDSDGCSEDEYWIKLRLEIEMLIRRKGMRNG